MAINVSHEVAKLISSNDTLCIQERVKLKLFLLWLLWSLIDQFLLDLFLIIFIRKGFFCLQLFELGVDERVFVQLLVLHHPIKYLVLKV